MYEENQTMERLTSLEQILGSFIVNTDKVIFNTNRSIEQLSMEIKEFKNEMKEFKEEMREFKNESRKEMKEFKEEMREFKNESRKEMKEFKEEMKAFKDEMSVFKAEMKEDRKNMNKQWGELANKMGTLVEDIISPAVRPVMKQYFGESVDYISVNVRKNDKKLGLKGEFDVIAYSSSFVFLVETKSSPKETHLYEFKNEVIPRFQQLFPEFTNLTLIPVCSALRFEPELVEKASEMGILLLAFKEWEYMDILNFDAFKQVGTITR